MKIHNKTSNNSIHTLHITNPLKLYYIYYVIFKYAWYTLISHTILNINVNKGISQLFAMRETLLRDHVSFYT